MNFIKGGRKEGNGIIFVQYLLYIRHCPRWFICIHSHNNSMKLVYYVIVQIRKTEVKRN